MNASPHTLTGAYAADALADTERLAFERHLDACPACAHEVRELQAAAAWMASAEAVAPPPALWDRVRAETAVTRQLPPVPGRARWRARPGPGGAVAGMRGRRLPPLLAAAALLVAVVSLAALNLGVAGGPGRPEPAADLVAAVLAAPDARRVAALPGAGVRASVAVSPQRGQAVFLAGGLPPAPAGRTYQLWVVRPAGPRPAGLVEAAAGGKVTRLLEGRVTGSEQVAMTVERSGGAARPTTAPVVVIDLRA